MLTAEALAELVPRSIPRRTGVGISTPRALVKPALPIRNVTHPHRVRPGTGVPVRHERRRRGARRAFGMMVAPRGTVRGGGRPTPEVGPARSRRVAVLGHAGRMNIITALQRRLSSSGWELLLLPITLMSFGLWGRSWPTTTLVLVAAIVVLFAPTAAAD